ncbi:MAG: CHASE2 domain-containing protein [Cyanomargarita calcarea GSE-NOS-MK-12-04C]|jgi:CHASE2 domain-containing sensor protein/tRNA A-37 threonylcarbamoyl transferase component Bud32|uniref:non-specific serine/threonine protein kinase n=1 Tax=Cyanomargarita calcarea GSE-NOS-MK-12-04C TaxID=2839659 RepID=A0A951UTF8_9CYAN|nr:CHASE2 domain-containing protein [Cyanomargarita calcarea GSE-NOS-MK-12-04C]
MLASLRNILTQPAVVASVMASVLLVGVQRLGVLEPIELKAFDHMMQWRTDPGLDPRILIIAFTENDIQKFKQGSPNGEVLDAVFNKLERYKPKIIGLDFFRDVPVEPGHQKLLTRLKNDSLIVPICKLDDGSTPAVPPPPGIEPANVGFADLLEDKDGVIRRNLIVVPGNPKSACSTQSSLAFQLAINYLGSPPEFIDENHLKLGEKVFQRLKTDSGGYRDVDARGFQILLNYRSASKVAQQVSLTDLLGDRFQPDWVKDRIVLIGTTAPSSQDIRYTPYSSGKQDNSGKMPGVVIHAQMVSQILDAVVSDKQVLFWFLPEWGEILWLWSWTLVGGIIASRIGHPLRLALTTSAILGIFLYSYFVIFTMAGWVPLAPALFGFLSAQAGVIVYTAFQNKQQKEKIALQIHEQKETISLLQTLLKEGGGDTAQTPTGITGGLLTERLLNQRYRVIELLGSGGFSYTYLSEDTHRPGNLKCVVKYLQPARKDDLFLEVARRLFKTEAEMLELLGQHDQIPQLMAYFEENQQFFLVQEYIPGHSLEAELNSIDRLTEGEVIDLLKDVLHILVFVHDRGVIHRDLKPSNLMRRQKDRRIVLIDFGAVKQIQPTVASENATIAVGTVGYAPPEQFMGQPRLNSDIYGLGMIAIQALTGTQAKNLERDSTTTLIWRHLAQPTDEFAAILDKMVCFDFQKRYQSAREVLSSLEYL